jgi:probable phosphoglycerate mutase
VVDTLKRRAHVTPGVTAPTTTVLVRHGETEWNREGRMQGWAPTELTDRGRREARSLGTALADRYDFDRVVASDLARCQETTALLAQGGVDPEPVFERGWRERGLGVCQGLTREVLFERFPALSGECGTLCIEERPEGGESLRDVCERVRANWQALCEHTGETALVVTHGGPIRVVLALVDEQDILTTMIDRAVPNCAVTEIRVDADATIQREAARPAALAE